MPDNRIRRALISVWDKTGVVELARALHGEFGIEIISTGGTAKSLCDAGIPVTLIEEITGFPEMLDGRVKTLHPKVHAAILADRDNPDHLRQLAEQGIQPIDLVVVNLYPFEKTVADPNCTLEQAIEMIDIGGVALLRAAAKNHRHVIVLTGVRMWKSVRDVLAEAGDLPATHRAQLARAALHTTGRYDRHISAWLAQHAASSFSELDTELRFELPVPGPPIVLRYGENPGQYAAVRPLFGDDPHGPHMGSLLQAQAAVERVAGAERVRDGLSAGVEFSYNNYLDADAALGLCAELSRARRAEPRASARAVSPISDEPRASARAVSPISDEPRASARAVSPISDEPRASARAVSEFCGGSATPANVPDAPSLSPGRAALQAMLQPPDPLSSTWLLTWSTYGTWLPGDARGFVSRVPRPDGKHLAHNLPGELFDADQAELRESARERMHGSAVHLQQENVDTLLGSFAEISASHRIGLLAVAVMTDHVHLICQSDRDGAELMQLFKGASSRRLSQACRRVDAPRWWTKSGSRRHIRAGVELQPAVEYLEQQQGPLAVLSYRLTAERAEKSRVAGGLGTARAEARGSSVGPDAARAEVHSSSLASDTARAEARGSSWGCVCVLIKHTNPCGVGIATAADRSEVAERAAQVEAYRRAYLGDPNAAMGGVLACNFVVDGEFALEVLSTYERLGKPLRERGSPYAPGGFFVEVWLAPRFTDAALAVIRGNTEQLPAALAGATRKKWGETVRLLEIGDLSGPPDESPLYRSIAGGMLLQTPDLPGMNEADWKIMSKRAPTEAEWNDLRLAWLVCKHTKSNAITICRDGMLIGNGAGQMSRVMSCRIATWLARENGHAEALHGAAAASDAFFPFKDGPAVLLDAGVTALIQPGGSKRDDETIALCEENNAALVLTGTRHFRH